MEAVSVDSEQAYEDGGSENELDRDCDATESDGQIGSTRGTSAPPAVGMEFECYDDVYNYYNSYAKELGFGVRVRNSWYRRESKEKYGAVLCCSNAGFKEETDANNPRPETRTGCLAMIRMKLMDESKKWRVVEVKLEHNHLLDPASAQKFKSHYKGTKRKLQADSDAEVPKIKFYRTLFVDGGYGNSVIEERDSGTIFDQSKQLKLKKGDTQAIYNYFCRMQLTNPTFFYLMEHSDEGHLRNLFWADARSRVAYEYFGDAVAFDTTCLSHRYEVPLVVFVGTNHHGQSVLLGCGLLAVETLESYIWLFRAWLTCMSGNPPQTIITDHCKALQSAIAEVFPKAHHRLCLSRIMQKVPDKLGGLRDYEAIKRALNRAVYDTLKVEEFETAWQSIIQHYGIRDHEWLKTLYENRERWAPVFLKDTFFAGLSTAQQNDAFTPFFDGYVHKQTSLKEFLDRYELALQKKHQKEVCADIESRDSLPALKTKCQFELQISKVYTKEIFKKFQTEVEEMYSCFSTTQLHVEGTITIFLVKERVEGIGNNRIIKNYEVLYDKVGTEVRCICSCFHFKGYLCRHALCVLNYNGMEEIPSRYILPRWRKDFKCTYVPNHGSNQFDVNYVKQRYDYLFRHALQLVEEGVVSRDHYRDALQAIEESLNKVYYEEGHLNN